MKKNITAKISPADEAYSTQAKIRQLDGILRRFATEAGFDEYIELNSIRIGVGEDDAEVHFSPRTWEAAEQFIMTVICHLIESEGLDRFPYYGEMADRYAAALGEERGSFDD